MPPLCSDINLFPNTLSSDAKGPKSQGNADEERSIGIQSRTRFMKRGFGRVVRIVPYVGRVAWSKFGGGSGVQCISRIIQTVHTVGKINAVAAVTFSAVLVFNVYNNTGCRYPILILLGSGKINPHRRDTSNQ